MAYWAATNKKDGRVLFVGDQNYDIVDWDLVQLPRKPTEFDDFDGTKLIKNTNREKQAKKVERSNGLSREALVDMIEVLAARITALENGVK